MTVNVNYISLLLYYLAVYNVYTKSTVFFKKVFEILGLKSNIFILHKKRYKIT